MNKRDVPGTPSPRPPAGGGGVTPTGPADQDHLEYLEARLRRAESRLKQIEALCQTYTKPRPVPAGMLAIDVIRLIKGPGL